MNKRWTRTDYLAFQQRKAASAKPSDTKAFAVYHCGKKVYENAAPGLCHNYIKANNLKGATVGYA